MGWLGKKLKVFYGESILNLIYIVDCKRDVYEFDPRSGDFYLNYPNSPAVIDKARC